MTMNNPFFGVVDDTIKAIVESRGDILITRDPALDAQRQVEQMYDLMEEGVEAIFLAPVDFDVVLPIIRAAREKGIKVIMVDTEIYEEDLADCMIVSDNYQAGVLCAEYLMEQKESAEIVILEHSRAKSANDRVAGFVDTIAGNEDYRVVEVYDALGQLELAMPIMQKAIEEDVKFDTVFAINDVSAMGAMAALEEYGKLKDTCVLGVDGAPETKAMIQEGLMTATAAQYPTKIGTIAAEQLYAILNGEEHEHRILIPVELINRQNVSEYGTNGWQ
ncbi:MAG: sugar ABC transporter substrate-binding protein [Clostridiales bacterium]|nr:sugar ABC transporter substrate-binding protein [Clostridiales bacterium]